MTGPSGYEFLPSGSESRGGEAAAAAAAAGTIGSSYSEPGAVGTPPGSEGLGLEGFAPRSQQPIWEVMEQADAALRHALQSDGLVVGGNDTQERLANFVTSSLNASQVTLDLPLLFTAFPWPFTAFPCPSTVFP